MQQDASLFGKYHLLRRLAMGGMAEIFRAQRVGPAGFSRDLVIKRIHPEFSEDTEFVRMFTNEATFAAKLRHPNIVQVLDFDQVGGVYYIAMELVDGADLKRVQSLGEKAGKKLPFQLAIFVIIQVLKGLAHAHNYTQGQESLNIVHRDVSPHNILLSEEGEVKLTDFGIARVMQHASATASGVLKGKTSYMAPEQTYTPHVDWRADLFAVGVILWELLCHRRLFAANNDLEAVKKVRQAVIPPPHSIDGTIPEQLSALVMEALEREPKDRVPDAKTFAKKLQRFLWLPSAGEELGRYMQLVMSDSSAIRDLSYLNEFRAPMPSGALEWELPVEQTGSRAPVQTEDLASLDATGTDTDPQQASQQETSAKRAGTQSLGNWSPPGATPKPPLAEEMSTQQEALDPALARTVGVEELNDTYQSPADAPQFLPSTIEDEPSPQDDWMLRTETSAPDLMAQTVAEEPEIIPTRPTVPIAPPVQPRGGTGELVHTLDRVPGHEELSRTVLDPEPEAHLSRTILDEGEVSVTPSDSPKGALPLWVWGGVVASLVLVGIFLWVAFFR